MSRHDPAPSLLSDNDLRTAICRDLREIYAEVVQEPLPETLVAALHRLELQAGNGDDRDPRPQPAQR